MRVSIQTGKRKPKTPHSLFGQRLREARLSAGIAQDKLGVLIGIDEGCSSARMSRYENGVHAPPFDVAVLLAKKLKLPVAYFYCEDARMAEILKMYHSVDEKKKDSIFKYAKTQVKKITF